MSPFDALAADLLASSADAFQKQKGWAERAVAQLSDDQLHTALDENSNCIAVIMKHVAGNLLSRWTDFLSTDGEKAWRNRDDEFVDTLTTREELLAYWEQGWNCLFEQLQQLRGDDLSATVKIRGEPHSVPLALQRSLAHCSYHVGQIMIVARVLAGPNWKTITIPRGQSAEYNERTWGQNSFQQRNR